MVFVSCADKGQTSRVNNMKEKRFFIRTLVFIVRLNCQFFCTFRRVIIHNDLSLIFGSSSDDDSSIPFADTSILDLTQVHYNHFSDHRMNCLIKITSIDEPAAAHASDK